MMLKHELAELFGVDAPELKKELAKFFGVEDLNEVNPIFPLILYTYPEKGFPEWLRGLSKYSQLPRVDKTVPMPYKVTINNLDRKEIASRIGWIVETLKGSWRFCDSSLGILYDTQSDAIRHRLRWGDDVAIGQSA